MSFASLVEWAMPHLIIAPILLPMATAALMLLLGDTRRPLKAVVNVLSCVLGVAMAIGLVFWVQHTSGVQAVGVYLPANWPVPYGIVLVADRLSAMMVLLTSVLGLAAVLYASARWHKAGVHFHPLFQLQLMGLYGAFLTADLFNLFVFFEIMLTASYGLLLHGSGWARVRSGLHYIAMNLMASSMFLIGVAMLYGVTGTLNMADMAIMVPAIPEDDRGLLHAGAAILAVAFLVKAAAWPLNFWLPSAYSAAAAPVSALFAILTKLGVYAILRVWTLLFPQDAGVSALFGGPVLVGLGLVTLAFGALGIIATQHLGRMAAFCAILSSGTLLAGLGFGQPAVTGGALYYTLGSTLAISAFFLLVELVDRTREVEEKPLYISEIEPDDAFAFPVDLVPTRDVNLDDDEQALIGRAIPAAMAFLGLAFIVCALTIAGLPPMAGFVGKVVMLSALLNPAGFGEDAGVSGAAWLLLGLLLVGGLLTIIAMSRAGVRYFWATFDRPLPRLRIIETLPIGALLLLVGVLVWQADAVLRYVNATARGLHDPKEYIGSVLSAKPLPSPTATGEGGLRR
ncbi:monovalent cation/H+ antiporter subunit D [Ottowia beijingensis]|uniref:monovalent cation/H+ antiporter subunit D n=1 Tax=Ottowia beijingensis TaxID=1207057 RepID=UPI002C3BBE9F|nr:monovalent cation/H+ antiporter subunit D [Ottowia beijingensis]